MVDGLPSHSHITSGLEGSFTEMGADGGRERESQTQDAQTIQDPPLTSIWPNNVYFKWMFNPSSLTG